MNILLLFVEKGVVDKLKIVAGLYIGKLISLDVETCICIGLLETLDNFGFLSGTVFGIFLLLAGDIFLRLFLVSGCYGFFFEGGIWYFF